MKTADTLLGGWKRAAGAILLATAVAVPAADASSVPEGLFGEWAGRAAEAEPPLGEFGDTVRVSLKPDGSGFVLSGSAGTAGDLHVTMAPTAQPNVFGPSSGNGMLSMFRSDDPPDPLAGEQLRWARLAGNELIVYAFHIDGDGTFVLDRYAFARDGDELALRLTRRDGVAAEHVLVARLGRGS